MHGIVPGGTFTTRLRNPALPQVIRPGAHSAPLNAFLARACEGLRAAQLRLAGVGGRRQTVWPIRASLWHHDRTTGGIVGIQLYQPGHQRPLRHHHHHARHRGLRAALVVLTAAGVLGLTALVAVALLAARWVPVP
jgi:hypothetical protein